MTSLHQTHHGSLKQDAESSWQTGSGFADTALAQLELLGSLKDAEYREGFIESHVYTGIAFQIRTLREKRELTQDGLGKVAKMAQERISILEDPNADTKPTLNTLLRLAKAFGVGLRVRFASFRELIDEAVRTDEDDLDIPGFDDELRGGLERDLFTQKQFAERRFASVQTHAVSPLLVGEAVSTGTGQTATKDEKTSSGARYLGEQDSWTPRIGPGRDTMTRADEVRRCQTN